MKSFLLRNGTPIIRWGSLPDNVFYEGVVPEGFDLAVSPSNNYVIIDVDVKNGKNGFIHMPMKILDELALTFHYPTKSGGEHYFVNYTGDKTLINKSTQFGLDLRIGAKKGNAGGYVKYHHNVDIRQCIPLIKETSENLNKWLEALFS